MKLNYTPISRKSSTIYYARIELWRFSGLIIISMGGFETKFHNNLQLSFRDKYIDGIDMGMSLGKSFKLTHFKVWWRKRERYQITFNRICE